MLTLSGRRSLAMFWLMASKILGQMALDFEVHLFFCKMTTAKMNG